MAVPHASDREEMDEPDVDALIELGQDLITSIFEGAPLEILKSKVESGAPLWYAQEEDNITALHAAAYIENEELIRYLIEQGALWNAVDNLHNTAGDIALSFNNESCYRIIRDAGIRSELLLALLSSKSAPADSPLSLVLKATDTTAAGSTDAFLSSRLRFVKDEHKQEICLLALPTGEEIGVMMGWERGIMQQTVRKTCSDHPNLANGLKVLNIGFGLGIVDSLFQALPTLPSEHIIIEPHPDVLAHMRRLGWYEKKGVKILEGKWQDFIDNEVLLGAGGFDVVYTDTFSEDYRELRQFFEHVPDLLAGPDSRFSFFNGLGATNALFYDVYTYVSDLHLAEIGINVEWSDVDVFVGGEERWGKTREYFGQRLYRLPVGRMRAT